MSWLSQFILKIVLAPSVSTYRHIIGLLSLPLTLHVLTYHPVTREGGVEVYK